jgi:hypothetical protein
VVTTSEEPAATAHDQSPPAKHRWWRDLGPRELLAWAIVAGVLLLPIRGMMRNPGPQMEEGFMLVFPDRLLHGAIPNRDFLHLYGPGSLWVLAGVYKVFGTDLYVQRFFALLQQAGVAFGMYSIARWWGRRVAVASAVLVIVIMLPPAQLTAFAWTGAVALALVGLGVGLHARATRDERRGVALAVMSGILFGAAFLYRLDFVIACTLVVGVLIWGAPRRRSIALAVSAIATASLVLVQFVLAGFGTAFKGMVLQPVFDLRPGRGLPIPPNWNRFDGFPQIVGSLRRLPWWPVPTVGGPKQLFFWFFLNLAAIAFVTAVGIWAVRRDRTSIRARAVLAGGLLSLGVVSQSLQRADSTHIAWVSCISIALVPVAMMEVLTAWERSASSGAIRAALGRHARLLACAIPIAGMFIVVPNFSFRTYYDYSLLSFGHHRESYVIRRGDRIFYYGEPTIAAGANALVPVADQYVRPGDRLFTGTVDLSRTYMSEAWWYYLFPETTPGTRYIEMDPGIADAKGSGLAHDLLTSDVVILSNVQREWVDPNESSEFRDQTPNRVLQREFCMVGEFGDVPDYLRERVGQDHWWQLWVKCDRIKDQPTPGP